MADGFEMGTRRFGRVNWLGLATLASREVQRFMAVWTQTLLAPLVTAGLFLMIFTIAIGPRRGDVMGVDFMTFPGAGHPDDDGDPECLCQYLVVDRDRQGAGQYR